MFTASRREPDFRNAYIERQNDVIQKCARRRGKSSISSKCDFPTRSKCARRRGESSIFERPILRGKMTLYGNMQGVEARVRILETVVFLRSTNVHGVEARARFSKNL